MSVLESTHQPKIWKKQKVVDVYVEVNINDVDNVNGNNVHFAFAANYS